MASKINKDVVQAFLKRDSSGKHSRSRELDYPLVSYQLVDMAGENGEQLNGAFDTLFKETAKLESLLTTMDN